MIIFITGASHTGKTLLAQKFCEKYNYPYLSIDHLKMGLIRSGNSKLSATSNDEKLTNYLWPILREITKTAIENCQNLIIEGCYIPYNWKDDFSKQYLNNIKYYCLIMSEKYIKEHFLDIKRYSNIIENRLDDSDFTLDNAIDDNKKWLESAQKFGLNYILINDKYDIEKIL